jgi:RNAse (barnase) inhibitor barstar
VTTEYTIDGSRIGSLEEFYDEISHVLIPGHRWGRNLDAFDDILKGGFGTPERIALRWRHSEKSRLNLGHPETARQLELQLAQCHPANWVNVKQKLADARAGIGPTVFDWLVEIIQCHGPGADEAEDDVQLVLE